MDLENWKDIKGYEGLYKVSDLGRVKSLDRTIIDKRGHSYSHSGKVLNPTYYKGYLTLNLSKDGKGKTYLVHRLVAEAFIPNPTCLPCVNHKYGDKQDNKAENLIWCTHSENNQHAYDTGLKPRGSGHGGSSLTEDQVVEVCNILDTTNLTNSKIASKYNVHPYTISAINTGKSWNWLTGRRESRTKFDQNGKNNPMAKAVINCRGCTFGSIAEAAIAYGIKSSGGVTQACQGKLKTSGTYSDGTRIKWKYINEEPKEPNHG